MEFLRLAIDTNIAVPIVNRDRELRHLTRGFRTLYVPVVVLAELHEGILHSKDIANNLERLRRLTDRCEVLNVDESCAIAWAKLRVKLRTIGKPIPDADVWIAAICIANDIPLATRDAHFQHVPGLQIVRY